MDDDSLDELVDQSPGQCAHPRLNAAPLASDAESSDGDSGGSEDTGSELSDSTDGEDEEEDLEDGSDSGDDEDLEVVAVATQRKLEANGASNSDDDAESCPICLNTFRDQAVGTPENCVHYFCLDCILEWSKNANSCPVDRTIFKCICIRAHFGGKVLKKVSVNAVWRTPPTLLLVFLTWSLFRGKTRFQSCFPETSEYWSHAFQKPTKLPFTAGNGKPVAAGAALSAGYLGSGGGGHCRGSTVSSFPGFLFSTPAHALLHLRAALSHGSHGERKAQVQPRLGVLPVLLGPGFGCFYAF